MPSRVIVVRISDNDLYADEYEYEDDARRAIEEDGQKAYLISVEAPFQCWHGIDIKVEPHT